MLKNSTSSSHKRKPHIVVADDDAATRCVITTTLEHAGFTVTEASCGQEAIDAFKSTEIDAILMDVEMPGTDGYQACEAIRQYRGGADLPIVMVTGHDDSDSIDHAFDIGATDFISKPINWSLIGHRLRYILRGAAHLQSLGVSEAENRALIAAIPDSISIVDPTGVILHHLSNDESGSQDTAAERLGRNIRDVLPAAAADGIARSITTVLSSGEDAAIEYRLERPGTNQRWYESRFTPHADGKILIINRDISSRKTAEVKIHRLAYYDSLTGLPNRALFKEKFAAILEQTRGSGRDLAVFNIDLNRFKRINDNLGAVTGDAVLIEMAARLSKFLDELLRDLRASGGRPDCCLASFGGDEFALAMSASPDLLDFSSLAKQIRQRLAEPMVVNGHEFVVTSSVGVAASPAHGESVEVLLKNAESARDHAKRLGRNSQKFYRSSMSTDVTGCLDLENELRRALENNELSMFYQPKYRTRNLQPEGAEALLRWHHPERGEIPPNAFIPIAEESGLITDLGYWVANTVCRQIALWKRMGIVPGPIAVNLSGQQFGLGSAVLTLTEAVRDAGIDASALELEITETVLMSDIRSVTQSLHALREEGFSLAVDDFGTGYSSLRYLQRFPVDVLKIDASFVQGLGSNSNNRAICAAIIAMARGLGLTVVAEGVENNAQLEFLNREGCDTVQGFLMSVPLSASDYVGRLQKDAYRQRMSEQNNIVAFGKMRSRKPVLI